MPGLRPRRFRDHRRYSYAHTFGTTSALIDCDLDLDLANFNQNEPNPVTGEPAYPNGCTGFTRADIATNEDKTIYKPGFTYGKTCLIENVPVGQGCSLESAMKSGIVYGLQAIGETTDQEALAHRRGPYFEVRPVSGQDYFNAIWSALQVGQRCISVGTPWFPELTYVNNPVDSVILRETSDWHNWEACGVQTINGTPYMKVKAWTGRTYWFGRAVVNALMSVQGSDCLADTDGKYQPTDIQTVRLTIMQTLLSFMYRLLGIRA